MTDPAAGWYADPDDSSRLRWWDGRQWTTQLQNRVDGAPPVKAITPRRLSRTQKIVIVVVCVIALAVLASIAPALVLLLSLIALGLAIFVIWKGAAPKMGMRSRKSGFAALGVSFALFLGAGSGFAATAPDEETSSARPHALVAPTEETADSSPKSPAPVETTYAEVEESTPIPFEQQTVTDDQRDVGVNEIITAGVEGTKVTTYRVTYHDGVEVARELVAEAVAQEPVAEVTAQGTRQQPAPAPAEPVPFAAAPANCDPNYAGACVPIASDVDCEGGSGDGPEYVRGPVQIVGSDIYDLDRDGDGIACDK